MGIEADVMDAVLDLFNTIYPVTTQLRGYNAPDQIPPDQLPQVSAFTPTTAGEDAPYQQYKETLGFVVQAYDVQGKADGLRVAFSALATQLDRDPTLGGLVQRCTVTGFGITETGSEEPSSSGATIEAVFFSEQLFTRSGDDTELLFAAENIDALIDGVGPDPNVGRAGVRVPNSLEVQKLIASNVAVVMQAGTISDPPYNFDPTILQPWKNIVLFYYVFSELLSGEETGTVPLLSRVQFQAFKLFNNVNNYFDETPKLGWNRWEIDLDAPGTTQGAAIDMATDNMAFWQFAMNTYQVDQVTQEYSFALVRMLAEPTGAR